MTGNMSMQAVLVELGYAIKIQHVHRTWSAISAILAEGGRERSRRQGYPVDLDDIGRVHVSGYRQQIQFKFTPAYTDTTSTPWESVLAMTEAMNHRLRNVPGVSLDPALLLEHAVIKYTLTFDGETVPQSLQQWMRYLESICADVVCDHGSRCITVPAPSRTIQGRVSTLELRAEPQRSERSSTLFIRMSVYKDLLETVTNKTRRAKWSVRELGTQHELLLGRKLEPLLADMQHYRSTRCVLAPADLTPAAARAFHAWISGRGFRCSNAVLMALGERGVDVAVAADTSDRKGWATPVLSPKALRRACTRTPLLLAVAPPPRVRAAGEGGVAA